MPMLYVKVVVSFNTNNLRDLLIQFTDDGVSFSMMIEMGDVLVAGCHSDQAIEINKGPPVLSQSDRFVRRFFRSRS